MALENSILLGQNLIDTVSASTEAGEYLASNLLNDQPSEVWRGTNGNNHIISGGLSALSLVSGVALGNHNLSAETLRLELFSDYFETATFDQTWTVSDPEYTWGTGTWGNVFSTFGGYPLIESGIADNFIKTFTSVVALYYRITISGITSDYPEAGVLYLGKAFQPVKNVSRDPSVPVIDPSSIEMTRGQSMRSDNRTTYREITVNWPVLTIEEAHALRRIVRTTGRRGLMVFSLLPGGGDIDEQETSMICRMVTPPTITRRPDTVNDTYFASPTTFREAL